MTRSQLKNSARPPTAPLDRSVFYPAAGILGVMVLVAVLLPDGTDAFFGKMLHGIVTYLSWYYVLVVAVILVAVVFFALSRFGEIKLGPDHAEPDYSYLSWFSMLFAAGMGIGLMFFGVSEPVMHFLSPPHGEAGTIPAAREAMRLTFFHWGVHAWSIYAVVALVLAYFGYRHNLPLTLRSALYPLIGERIYGPLGTAVDVFAIIGTTFGVATSLGLGVQQINSGLNYLFGVPKEMWVQVLLIVGTAGLATVSVVAGLDAGIKRLSEINIALAIALMVAVLILGPTVYLLQTFMQNTGSYLSELVGKTFNLYAYDPTDWLGGWTIFYWGWWISWAPFVGLFIARISRGRTLREFVLGAMLVPTLFTLLWMTVFGNSAIDLILNQDATTLGGAVQADVSVALFRFFEHLPMSKALSLLAVGMIIVFFVTSADSGAMVLNMLCSNGRDDTPVGRRLFWMAMIGVTALVLMLAGGLTALQTAAIAGALPFSLAMLAAMWGFAKALRVDDAKRRVLVTGLHAPFTNESISWRKRVRNLLSRTDADEVRGFLRETVVPAMSDFAAELREYGVEARVIEPGDETVARLEILHGEEREFVYEVVDRSVPTPIQWVIGVAEGQADQPRESHRAEVHLGEGSQDYDIMGWTREQVTTDILEQYESHLHFLHVVR